ncbi:ribonuclease M5 [Spiroplasma chrysopicola]|uniref:Ribonuclease M5 n=1 Tax=Spiroplasma chrysopicola DF-1 TaxID=1276227 RepID=R4UCF9_9MOLU|nr:ribonuclease M5 [Spiroplasma chrysopicola]AGM25579.1 primase-like protein [Spiroplasma chrysopicola DF-1]
MEKIVIVVEGKTDTAKIKNIFPTIATIETSGSAISPATLALIKKLSLTNKIIIFTDPDYPGQKIRDIVSSYLDNNCYHAFIDKNKAIRNKKVGIAQASDEDIKTSLGNVIQFTGDNNPSLSWTEYVNIVEDSNKRRILQTYYNWPPVNNKKTYKWLTYLNITQTELRTILEEKNNATNNKIQ